MERRNFLEKLGMGAAAAGSFAGIPSIAAAETIVATDANSMKAADFGAVGNGTGDDAAAIQRAIDAAHNLGGGTVYLDGSKGRDFRCATQISFDGRRGVRLVGGTGPNVSGAGQPNAQLNYAGNGTTPFISLRSCHSISFEGLMISYSDPGFHGSLVASGHTVELKSDPSHLIFDRCRFAGSGRASGADALLSLSLAICSTVRNCEFMGANTGVVGVGGRGQYSNVIQITDTSFRDINKVAIRNAGESWIISGCTFEPLNDGRAAAYQQGVDTSAWGLIFTGCWMGDASVPGGCWIDVTAGPAYGLTISGNRIASPGPGPRDTAIRIGSGNQGVTISGNRIEGAVGIDFTAAYTFGASILGNDLQCKTPIANLEHVMCHFVAGHYTVANQISGPTTFEAVTFLGDGGVRGNINLNPQNFVPTTPHDGDLWVTKSGLFIQIAGVTRKVTLT